MKNILKSLLLFSSLFLFIGQSYGQFQGPGATTRTIEEIRENAFRLSWQDALVHVKGFVVRQINYDTYEFKDSTGSITIELEAEFLPNRPFDDKTEVTLIGEVEYRWIFGTRLWIVQVILPE